MGQIGRQRSLMARTILEGLGRRRLSLHLVHRSVRSANLHLPKLPGANVSQLNYRLLGMHHQRLHPDDRHLPGLHPPHQLDAHLGILRRAGSPRHHLLLGQLQRRHLLRKVGIQRVRRESDSILLHPGSRSDDPADSDQTQDTCVDFIVAARSVFIQQQLIPQGRLEKYDRVRSLIRNHPCVLHHLLQVALERLPANRGQGHRPAHRRNHRIMLIVDRLVDAGRVVFLSVPEPLIVHH